MKLIIEIPNANLEFLQSEEPGTMVIRLSPKLEKRSPKPTPRKKATRQKPYDLGSPRATGKTIGAVVSQPADGKLKQIVMDDKDWQ